jgi:acyl-CoA synthetase (AMP-forming)/AMP-acid ligase II
MGLRDYTLHNVLKRNARQFGDRPAIVFDGRRITHAQFLARASALAGGLAAAGIGHADRIAVLAQNRLEYLDLYAAAAVLGAAIVPINWRLNAEEVAHAIADTTPTLVFADAEYQPTIAAVRERCSSVRACYGFDKSASGFLDHATLAIASADSAPESVGADDTLVILHTAAVSGLPRGAQLSHASLLASGIQLMNHWRLGPEDVNLGVLPLFHLSGLGLFLAVLQAGGATVLSTRFDAAAAARQIAEHRVTVFAEFAPMLGSILDAAEASGADLSSLRAITGLDTPPTVTRFEAACPTAQFWSGYGQSELSGMVTLSPFRERPGSAGRPALLADVAVFDAHERPAAVGSVGEIVVRGPLVFKGYWNRDADNAETFRGGWHHTGDMGRFDDDGYLWYAGRSPAKELIKPGGENVYPAEVERAILEHPGIAEVVVIGVSDAKWGEAIKAVCVLTPGAQAVTAAELIDFVASRIASFKKPKHIVFVDSIPKTAAGAIDRAQVKQAHGGT